MKMGLSDAKLCLWIGYLNDKAGRSWQRIVRRSMTTRELNQKEAIDLSIQLFTCHVVRLAKVTEPYTN